MAQASGTSTEQSEAIARQRAFGRQMRAVYNQITEEPVPAQFRDLLDELERKDRAKGPPPPDEDPKDGAR
jgi:hypothetical protein